MKTTLEIPDDLFKRAKAMAARRGESLKGFVAEALRARLEQTSAEVGGRVVPWNGSPGEVGDRTASRREPPQKAGG